MTLVGFKRLTIGVFGTDGKVTKKYVVEGKQDEGATSEAEITGLSKEATKVFGSNIAYYVSQKGVGDVSVNYGLLDLPDNVNDAILGYKAAESGITYIGEDTEPPYISTLMESEDLNGDKVYLGMLKGKMGRESIQMATTTNEAFEPEAEEYVMTCIADDKDGESKGQYVAKYIGKEDTSLKKIEDVLFPGYTAP